MKTVDVPQRSEAWFEARRGMPTASRFDKILTAVQAKPAAAQESLIAELIVESILPPEVGVIRPMTDEMRTGMLLEAEARCAYELEMAKEPVKDVGFVIHDSGLFGGSPDLLVGDGGGVDLKCPAATTHVSYIRAGIFPTDYLQQCHGYMIVTGRQWWGLFSYCRHFPPFFAKVERNEFTEKLEAELYRFAKKYNEARTKFNLPPIGNKP